MCSSWSTHHPYKYFLMFSLFNPPNVFRSFLLYFCFRAADWSILFRILEWFVKWSHPKISWCSYKSHSSDKGIRLIISSISLEDPCRLSQFSRCLLSLHDSAAQCSSPSAYHPDSVPCSRFCCGFFMFFGQVPAFPPYPEFQTDSACISLCKSLFSTQNRAQFF